MTLEPRVVPIVAATTSASDALARLRAEDAPCVVVAREGLPQAVLSPEELEAAGHDTLEQGIGAEISLVVVEDLGNESLGGIAGILERAGTAAAVVVTGEEIVGVVDIEAVAEALPLDQIAPGRLKGGLPGDPDAPARGYVCRRCSPPTYGYPRGGFEAPRCPRDSSHGRMEPDRG